MEISPASVVLSFDSIDSLLSNAFPPDGPGASIILVKDGQTLFRKGYGEANLEWGLPVTPETVFRIGSLTKQFTAVLVLKLARQGKLSLQDPIEKFLPDYPTHGHTITIEHLLAHTSGIKSYSDMKGWENDWGKSFTLEALIDYFKFQPMGFAPGQKWAYNNSGYVLLGAIIEKAAGKPYSEVLQSLICGPLGMTSTILELPGLLIPRRASGYAKSKEGFQNAPYINMTQPLAAGGMVSSVDDLARWDAALYSENFIPAEDLRAAQTARSLSNGYSTRYGYGWQINKYEGLKFIEHSGGIHGFVCHALRVPSQHLYAAVLMNTGDPDHGPDQVAFRAALTALGLPFPSPEAIDLPESDLCQFAGSYLLEPGAEVVFSCQDGALWFAWPGQDHKTRLQPCREAEFFDPKSPLNRFRFGFNELGSLAKMELIDIYGEVRLIAGRVEPVPTA